MPDQGNKCCQMCKQITELVSLVSDYIKFILNVELDFRGLM